MATVETLCTHEFRLPSSTMASWLAAAAAVAAVAPVGPHSTIIIGRKGSVDLVVVVPGSTQDGVINGLRVGCPRIALLNPQMVTTMVT